MMLTPFAAHRRRALRAALAFVTLAGLAACGRKGEVTDLLPPPPPTPPEAEKASGTGG